MSKGFPSYKCERCSKVSSIIKPREEIKGVSVPEGFKTELAKEIRADRRRAHRVIKSDPRGYGLANKIIRNSSPEGLQRLVNRYKKGQKILQ